MRGLFLVLLIGGLATVPSGCGGSYEFNRRTMRFERVGPRPRPYVAISAKDREQMPPPAQNPPVKLSAKQRTVLSRGQVYRFYLGDETARTDGDLKDLYRVRQTTPEKLAELLVLLFPGEGPGGSERIRWIVYSNPDTWDQAEAFVPRLDVAERRTSSPVGGTGSTGEADWAEAIGLLYGSEFPRRLDSDVRFRIVSRLHRVMDDPSQPTDLRWGAGVVSAVLQGRYEPKDPVAASGILSRTGRVVQGQDYKAMVVMYHHLRLLQIREQNLTVRRQAQEALNRFQSCEDTDCYRLILQMVEQK